jgi:DNA (cytosine-5)-methyltransferase 1
MKALDLFCKAGGTSMGLHRAGFEVTGVDIEPQKRYPFEFVLGDALEYVRQHGHEYDLIVAGPPCQLYSVTASLSNGNHPDLVGATREALTATGKPYIIENVPGAPLFNPIMLCGTMFPGLRVIRHRLFECSPMIWFPPAPCQHIGRTEPAFHGDKAKHPDYKKKSPLKLYQYITVAGKGFNTDAGRIAMNIDWMSQNELSQAIPPAYTEWLGKQMLKLI